VERSFKKINAKSSRARVYKLKPSIHFFSLFEIVRPLQACAFFFYFSIFLISQRKPVPSLRCEMQGISAFFMLFS